MTAQFTGYGDLLGRVQPVIEVGISIDKYYMCAADDLGATSASFIFFDNAGARTGIGSGTLGDATNGGETIAEITGAALPSGTAGALLTTTGPARVSTAAFTSSGYVTTGTLTYCPLGTLPANIPGATSSGGGGGGTQYTEGDVDTTFTGTVALVEGAGSTAKTITQHTDGGINVHISNTDGKTAKDLFGTAAAFTITLASLPTLESRISTQIDLTDANGVAANKLALFCAVKLGTVDIGDSVEFYWLRGDENAAPYLPGGLAATDTNYNAANTLLNRAQLMPYKIGRAFANATATPVIYFSTIINNPGPRGSLYVINSSKATTSATAGDHYARYIPLHQTVV